VLASPIAPFLNTHPMQTRSEPTSVKQAVKDKDWLAGMQQE